MDSHYTVIVGGQDLTGTGQIKEEFTKYLAETPQHKNVEAIDSTSSKMCDENFVTMITTHFE